MTTTEKRSLPIVSNSEMRTFRRCVREHHIAYRLKLRPLKRAEALKFGSLIHTGLEVWWKTVDVHGAVAAMRAVESDPYELAKAEALLLGYHARWEGEPLSVVAVEVQFECDLVNPETGAASKTFRLGGKIDAIVQRADGSVWIVEHKTSSEDIEQGSAYWKRLRLDSQIGTYYRGARALGHDVAGCIYDVIKKPTLRPYKVTPVEERKFTKDGRLYANQRERDETPEEFRARLVADIAERPERYFVRGDVVRLEDEERDAAVDAWMTAQAMRDAARLERFPKNPEACVRYGRECDYFAACCKEAALDDPTRFRVAKTAHEELEVVTAA